MNNKIQHLIKTLNLKPHPEGGYFRRTYQSQTTIKINEKSKSINTAIYYLLPSDEFSCWHRLRSDEIWHYYAGSPIIVHQIDTSGILSANILGNVTDNSQWSGQHIIPAGTWFAAEVEVANSFTLLGCTVAPGFEFEDFEIGQKDELLKIYPQYEKMILKFIRQ